MATKGKPGDVMGYCEYCGQGTAMDADMGGKLVVKRTVTNQQEAQF